jgi:hypothetical protein
MNENTLQTNDTTQKLLTATSAVTSAELTATGPHFVATPLRLSADDHK